MTEKTDPIQALVESNSAQELKAMASARGIDAKGTKVEIATRLVDQPGATTADTKPADSAPAEKPAEKPKAAAKPKAAKPAETSTPEGLKPPKVKAEDDGSRTVTVKREMTYIDLAAEVGYVGSPRELAAFNGVRNGRLELHPGDKVTIPAPYDPRA